MKKQWRAELRELNRNRKHTQKRFDIISKSCWRQMGALQLQIDREERATNRQTLKLDRRIAILEGRLS